MIYNENEVILPRNIEDEMKESYLRYSMSVIISRALPDVRDGLKPSQRRLLYAMRQLNLSAGGKHRKCAKICGDTSGDFHPHGEAVIYPTLARLAQYWVMRYRLVDGQGNFGSVDGDPPAAMRYTEARLTHASMQLMEDLDKDTVDHVLNYDETKKEPTVFPAKFPNLLCNGSSGIAVGMATNIPPHNLDELIDAAVLVLDNPQTTIEQIMEVMPGPDFPTGGIICGRRGILDAYHTGRGKLIVRARVETEEMPGGKERIVVHELPYSVNKARLIEHMADLINKKQITSIADLRDESDKDGLRMVIELKKGEMSEVTLNQLYKFTDLQTTFGCNMLALDKGLPRTMNVRMMIHAWCDHRVDVVRRRTRFELNKAEARAHVLEGYLKAIDNMDEVVRIVRGSGNKDEAKTGLIEKYQFTDKQASAVLDLRLYQLTSLEHDKIDEEYQGLLEKITYFTAVLASEEMVKEIIRTELREIQSKHKSPRATEILAVDTDVNMEDLIADEPVLITISEDDYIKRMPIDTFREQRRGGKGVNGMTQRKETDTVKDVYVASTHDKLLIFTSLGRLYWVKVWQIPEGSRQARGKPLVSLLEDFRPEEKIATTLRVREFSDDESVMMVTQKGIIKKTQLSAFSNPRRKGIWALNVDEDDLLIAAPCVKEGDQVMLFTRAGMAVRFDEKEARPMGRMARGVRGVRLKDETDRVIGAEVVSDTDSVVVVCENGFGKRSAVGDFRQTRRGGKGVRSIIISDRNGAVVGAVSVKDEDSLLMMTQSGQTVRIPMEEVRVMGRNTQGVRLSRIPESDVITTIQRLEAVDEVDIEEVEETEETAGDVSDS
jgi:DNA gyrase subunit A